MKVWRPPLHAVFIEMSNERLEKSERTPPVSWRPWVLAYSRDRPYNFSCLSAVSKNRHFSSFSRLWDVIWRGKAFRDQQCLFLTRNKSSKSENESNCSTIGFAERVRLHHQHTPYSRYQVMGFWFCSIKTKKNDFWVRAYRMDFALDAGAGLVHTRGKCSSMHRDFITHGFHYLVGCTWFGFALLSLNVCKQSHCLTIS